jgi:hypothetical protein
MKPWSRIAWGAGLALFAACDAALVGPGAPAAPDAPAAIADAGAFTPSDPCVYPAGAPAVADTRFQPGSIVPNLVFQREDGTTLSLLDIRCNRKNRLLVWLVGGDDCAPCVSSARSQEIPAWKALGAEGVFVLESFNGARFLVTSDPFPSWRRQTMWPPDGDSVALVHEPKMPPYYVVGRIIQEIPWNALIDLETMKVLAVDGSLSIPSLRMRLTQLPAR